MNLSADPSWNRRQILRTAGVSALGTVIFSQTANADENDADVSISIPDQETDGHAIIIESLETDTEAEF